MLISYVHGNVKHTDELRFSSAIIVLTVVMIRVLNRLKYLLVRKIRKAGIQNADSNRKSRGEGWRHLQSFYHRAFIIR